MAIKYLAGDRIVGTNAERLAMTTQGSNVVNDRITGYGQTENITMDGGSRGGQQYTGSQFKGVELVQIEVYARIHDEHEGELHCYVKSDDLSTTYGEANETVTSGLSGSFSSKVFTFTGVTTPNATWRISMEKENPAGNGYHPYYCSTDHTEGGEDVAGYEQAQWYSGNSNNPYSARELYHKLTYKPNVYPNLETNTIFECTDTGIHYLWDGSSAWNEIA